MLHLKATSAKFGRATKRWAIWACEIQAESDQNERQPIRLLISSSRTCDRTGSRDRIRRSGNRPLATNNNLASRGVNV